MNMPLDEDGQVNFTTTLFALIRENLSIKMRPAEEMDAADKELRETIKHIWPLQAKKMIDLVVPAPPEKEQKRMTVGKVYAGLLIIENWKTTKFGKIAPAGGVPVSIKFTQAWKSFLEWYNFSKRLLSVLKFQNKKYKSNISSGPLILLCII